MLLEVWHSLIGPNNYLRRGLKERENIAILNAMKNTILKIPSKKVHFPLKYTNTEHFIRTLFEEEMQVDESRDGLFLSTERMNVETLCQH